MKCLKDGCKGELKKINFITVFKYQGKCEKCGKHQFLQRSLRIYNPHFVFGDKEEYTKGIRIAVNPIRKINHVRDSVKKVVVTVKQNGLLIRIWNKIKRIFNLNYKKGIA